MAQTSRSRKPLWWALTLVAAVALVLWAYAGARKSNQELARVNARGGEVGTAYDPTTGRTVAAGALPGALGTGGPPPATGPGNSANGSAGGTQAGVNPQVVPAPGPVASGAGVPPANLKR